MKIQVSGRQIDVGEALRSHITTKLTAALGKYFSQVQDAHVVFAREGAGGFKADVRVRLGAGLDLESEATGHDIYGVFDLAAERIEKRARRYKRRLNEHHGPKAPLVPEQVRAQAYVISGEAADEHGEAPSEPLVIAEAETAVATLSVSEAVMRLELGTSPALVFKNGAHGRINVVFKRSDGHIGWVDPA